MFVGNVSGNPHETSLVPFGSPMGLKGLLHVRMQSCSLQKLHWFSSLLFSLFLVFEFRCNPGVYSNNNKLMSYLCVWISHLQVYDSLAFSVIRVFVAIIIKIGNSVF